MEPRPDAEQVASAFTRAVAPSVLQTEAWLDELRQLQQQLRHASHIIDTTVSQLSALLATTPPALEGLLAHQVRRVFPTGRATASDARRAHDCAWPQVHIAHRRLQHLTDMHTDIINV